MNETMQTIHARRSVRAYEDKALDRETVDAIVRAAMRSPTAGNMMLYSIIEVADQGIKDQLVKSCDNQPFIGKAPLVLLFLADYQRWFDIYQNSGVAQYCREQGMGYRTPGEGDLMLAACDALIAAQTAVIAAEALGIGSCYIGDILENFEFHKELFGLPHYVLPITMLCFGYPTPKAAQRTLTPRFPQEVIHFRDRYQRVGRAELEDMLKNREPAKYAKNAANMGQHMYARKFGADFSVEMTRSMKAALTSWTATPE